jgi:ceramide glucosyltransferase
MIPHPLRILEIIAAAAAIASNFYFILCLWSAARFHRGRKSDAGASPSFPPISILKPLKGTDPEMYESFRSHCLQDYPDYEIIFGVSEADDPAIALVERLKVEFPQRSVRLVICRDNLGPNTKVSNLIQMEREAHYDHLIVSDSDIRVSPNYLRRVISPLSDPQVGLVTCLYRGIGNSTLGSRLEALGVSTDFCPGVLVAQQIEGIKFGLGATLAFRRRELQAIGGFESLVDYLADDYQLGRRISALGLKVEIPNIIVETFLALYTLSSFFDHQLRWARTIRDSRFAGYVGMGVTYGLPWAILTLLLARGAIWAWVLLAITAVMRSAVALKVGQGILRDSQVKRWFALLPLRDVIAVFVWLVSFFGHSIIWRGQRFRLQKGQLVRIPE